MATRNLYSPDYDSQGNAKPSIPELKDAIEEAWLDAEDFAQQSQVASDDALAARDEVVEAATDLGTIGGINGTADTKIDSDTIRTADGTDIEASNHSGEVWYVVSDTAYYKSNGTDWLKTGPDLTDASNLSSGTVPNARLSQVDGGNIPTIVTAVQGGKLAWVDRAGSAQGIIDPANKTSEGDAVNDAVLNATGNGDGVVYIPEQLIGSYDNAKVTFQDDVHLHRFGTDPDEYNAPAYGAHPTNTETQNDKAFQTCLDHTPAIGGTITFLIRGVYSVSSLDLRSNASARSDRSELNIIGGGAGNPTQGGNEGSCLQFSGSEGIYASNIVGQGALTMKGFTCKGNGKTDGTTLFDQFGKEHGHATIVSPQLKHMQFGEAEVACWVGVLYQTKWERVQFRYNGEAIVHDNSVSGEDNFVNSTSFDTCIFANNGNSSGDYAVHSYAGSKFNVSFGGGTVFDLQEYGHIKVETVSKVTITDNCRMERATQTGGSYSIYMSKNAQWLYCDAHGLPLGDTLRIDCNCYLDSIYVGESFESNPNGNNAVSTILMIGSEISGDVTLGSKTYLGTSITLIDVKIGGTFNNNTGIVPTYKPRDSPSFQSINVEGFANNESGRTFGFGLNGSPTLNAENGDMFLARQGTNVAKLTAQPNGIAFQLLNDSKIVDKNNDQVLGIRESAVGSLTNNTGGSTDGTLASVSGSGDDATINDNLAELNAKLNAILNAIGKSGHGLTAD